MSPAWFAGISKLVSVKIWLLPSGMKSVVFLSATRDVAVISRASSGIMILVIKLGIIAIATRRMTPESMVHSEPNLLTNYVAFTQTNGIRILNHLSIW